jgi:hypothetical protein
MINSFMYRKETITIAYEGAGWAFPVETYRNTSHTYIHFQGFEILRRMHFPPTLILSQVLAESLEPNWLPPAEVMNGALLKGQKRLTRPNGMKLSILTTVLSSDETLLTSLNTAYSAS